MKIKAGIVGGAGYTAGELIRILLHHEFVELGGIVSSSNAGNPVYQVHDDLEAKPTWFSPPNWPVMKM